MYALNISFVIGITVDSSADAIIDLSEEITATFKELPLIVKTFEAEITSITNGGLVTITFSDNA